MTPKQIVDLFESEPELMDLDVPALPGVRYIRPEDTYKLTRIVRSKK